MGGPINFHPGTRERLIELGILSAWDDGSARARERHTRSLRVQYNHPTFQQRCTAIRELLEQRQRDRAQPHPILPGEKVVNQWAELANRNLKK